MLHPMDCGDHALDYCLGGSKLAQTEGSDNEDYAVITTFCVVQAHCERDMHLSCVIIQKAFIQTLDCSGFFFSTAILLFYQ